MSGAEFVLAPLIVYGVRIAIRSEAARAVKDRLKGMAFEFVTRSVTREMLKRMTKMMKGRQVSLETTIKNPKCPLRVIHMYDDLEFMIEQLKFLCHTLYPELDLESEDKHDATAQDESPSASGTTKASHNTVGRGADASGECSGIDDTLEVQSTMMMNWLKQLHIQIIRVSIRVVEFISSAQNEKEWHAKSGEVSEEFQRLQRAMTQVNSVVNAYHIVRASQSLTLITESIGGKMVLVDESTRQVADANLNPVVQTAPTTPVRNSAPSTEALLRSNEKRTREKARYFAECKILQNGTVRVGKGSYAAAHPHSSMLASPKRLRDNLMHAGVLVYTDAAGTPVAKGEADRLQFKKTYVFDSKFEAAHIITGGRERDEAFTKV